MAFVFRLPGSRCIKSASNISLYQKYRNGKVEAERAFAHGLSRPDLGVQESKKDIPFLSPEASWFVISGSWGGPSAI